MKMVHNDIVTHMDMGEGKISVLTIENPALFSNSVCELSSQISGEEGRFVLSDKGKLLDIPKFCELHSQLIPFEINQKPLLNKMYRKLEKFAVGEDFFMKTQELFAYVSEYAEELIFECQCDIECDDELSPTDIFKSLNMRFSDNYSSLSEKLLSYMLNVRELDRDKCFVFVNLKSYIDEDELKLFYRSAQLHSLNVLLIEPHQSKKLEEEQNILIDSDLCEISY